MTISFIICIIATAILGAIIAIVVFMGDAKLTGFGVIIVTIVVVFGMVLFGQWYYGNTAKGIRALKDQESNFNNGINREITITAEDGREIYHYSGKCDIETNDKYIIFEDEDGHRQMIYWGVTDTIIIKEIGG